MKSLTLLANKYGSDKGTVIGHRHGFTEIYDTYLNNHKDKIFNMIEIGVNDGSSLKMWHEYLPYAKIYGLDIDDKKQYNNDRVICHIVDQSNTNSLKNFTNHIFEHQFDFIIDDGSHHMLDQQITLGHFFPLLKSSGIYIIEDLHTSLCENGIDLYGRRVEIYPDRSNTTLFSLKNKPYNSVYLNKEQNNYIQNNIKDILIFETKNSNVSNDYKNKSITSIILKK
jgi:hypothetical protein